MNKSLKSLLNENPKKHIATLGFFSNYPVLDYFVEGDSALVLGKSDHTWAHLSSSSESELLSLLQKHHHKTKYYYSVDDWMIPIILQFGDEDWRMTTNRFVLDEEVHTDHPKLKIVSIDKSYASFMYNQSDYKEFLSIGYIEERLDNDISAGIFIEDTLVAWGFTHDDGALGFLHVLEDYRKKGYGLEIMLGLIQMRRNENRAVFGNIVPDNHASTALITKLGFKLDCMTSWLKLK